ncbi:MAG: metal-dependent hydrolase [Firmicutes bacterium]|nr:metal-dependent hydrolase [Bacillota bacterium]
MPKLRFLGHACFLIEGENQPALLFDPFLTGNPLAAVSAEEVKADYILVSHAHADHLGDAFSIARNNEASIISTAEIAGEAEAQDVKSHAMHIGGKHAFPFGHVKLTVALHGSGIAGGHACGFVVNYYGKQIYFAGDTGLFGDMKLIGELNALDLALLPIGDNFTMGIEDAALAASFLKAPLVIPFHYNTWPVIQAVPEEFKQLVEKKTTSRCLILAPGESYSWE